MSKKTEDSTKTFDVSDNANAEDTTEEISFKDIDWNEIDTKQRSRSKKTIIWFAIVSIWSIAVGYDIVSRYLLNEGQAQFPLIGTVSPVSWLWSITILFIIYYGVAPLYENPRMTKYYWREFKKNKAAVISGIYLTVIFIIGLVGGALLPDPEPEPGLENQPPVWTSTDSFVVGSQCPGGFTDGGDTCQGSWDHPFGTTNSGEDILMMVIQGMEVSMQVGLIASFMSIGVAAIIAMTAAYHGGLIDEGLMRYVDIQLTFPTFFLYLLLAYTIGGSLFVLIMIFGLFGWGSAARIMRAEALQRREEEFIKAAKAAGASSIWTIRRHLLPNISNSMITALSLTIPSIILAEAAVAFLGLSDATIPSWGRVIADGRAELSRAWWISTIPGIFLFLTVLAFNFLGDALRDALDPRHGGSKND